MDFGRAVPLANRGGLVGIIFSEFLSLGWKVNVVGLNGAVAAVVDEDA